MKNSVRQEASRDVLLITLCSIRRQQMSVLLAVYVDDILVTGSDTVGIRQIQEHLRTHFVTKNIDTPRYFLGIEFAYGKQKMTLSQRKYLLDLL